ncbi:MAG: sigma factor G inhibitor Gin [Peptococcia bacterium]|jgi:superfamily II helicase
MEERATSENRQVSIQGEEQREKKREAQPEEQKEKATRKETAVVSAPKVVPVCVLCKTVPPQGLRDGFYLKGVFICSHCEAELINSKPEYQSEYKRAIAKIKRILFQQKP